MKQQTKCPICGSSINWVYWTGPFGIEEEHMNCDHCGYSYEFVYGNYAAFIKGEEFYWSYNTPRSSPIFRRMYKLEWQAKHNWKRHRKTYLPKQADGYTTNQIIFDELKGE